jgi:hypothetical protein
LRNSGMLQLVVLCTISTRNNLTTILAVLLTLPYCSMGSHMKITGTFRM